jgi:hypothetical protein
MASPSSSFTPLSQAFSGCWPEHATVLVSDSVESDGRFVLHTLAASAAAAAAATATSQAHVLWFCCGAVTDQLTLSSLKRMMSGSGSGSGASSLVASASLPDGSAASNATTKIPPKHTSAEATTTTTAAAHTRSSLTIRSVPSLMDTFLLSEGNNETTRDEEWLARMLLGIVKDWVLATSRQDGSLLVLWDDVSTLANIMGENLTYGLLVSIQALSTTTRPFGLVVRYSHDVDVALEQSQDSMWLGGGGSDGNIGHVESRQSCGVPWERHLVELADVLVDVTPLPSGVTRHAHGRLYISGRTVLVASVYNYCLTDQSVLAMRL